MRVQVFFSLVTTQTQAANIEFSESEMADAKSQGYDLTSSWQLENYLGSHPLAWQAKLCDGNTYLMSSGSQLVYGASRHGHGRPGWPG